MSIVTTATLASSISWSQIDTSSDNSTISDLGDVSYSYALSNGSGISGEVNHLWHQYVAITGNETKSYDLSDLPSTYLGIDGSVSFVSGNVKSFIINNLSEVTGEYILISGHSTSGFSDPWLPGSSETYIQPKGSLMLNKPILGWDIDVDDVGFSVINQSTGEFNIEIALVGQSG